MYGNGISIHLLSLEVACLWVESRDEIDLSTVLLDVTVLTDTSGQSWCSKID